MDPRYPPHGDPQYGYSQRDGGYEEGHEGPWGQEQGQQYEDPSYADPAIDPGLESQSGRPTILPPGTLISGYRDYRPAGYSSYPSSSHSQQQQPQHQQHQQPPHEQHHQQHQQPHYDYAPYTYGGQDAASSYSPQHFTRPEAHRQQAQALERPRPEKKWLCQAEGCHRGMPGNGFTTLNDLERHGRSKHNDDGQYIECRHEQCPDRGKRFPRRDNFVDHYWRVHGEGRSKEEIKAYVLEKLVKDWMVEKKGNDWRQGL